MAHRREEAQNVAELVRTSPTLRARLDHARFTEPELKILLFDARYHLVRELSRALTATGHKVFSVPVLQDVESMVRGLLSSLVRYRPDFVLTVNHLGFDEDGTIGGLLETLEVPVAAWYVDSPLFVLRGRPVPAASTTVLFTWEKTLVPVFARACETRYLPLATDPGLFRGPPGSPQSAVAFVGDSGRGAQEKWKTRISKEDEPEIVRLERTLVARTPEVFADPELRNDPGAADRLAAATWRANTTHRVRLLSRFANEDLRVFGDDGWKGLLPRAHLSPGPDYGSDLANVYRRHAVNLNVTSLQMPTAVNQRVFDAPAAGAFVLSDAQEDLTELFQEDELVTWSSSDEAVDKARYYLKHPARREALVARGQRRVLLQHTYIHRSRTLVEEMRMQFGRGKIAKPA